ncbi:RNA polymerase sigma-70 factor [Pedobacter punctiformis]|uniref:RNA polymerase sigma-70 factor n=1 Tax=Pedobacter punctiformis TaxID=3004097 RepID=A0ABT4LC36_9SPHI|nr:RNA polymerase sigma-70 factor [Pedobacter sp. HCMS5-2]MCZ4245453.1 RNA polymerase sigma-70 factor [Pedobacter sp. HCMS5-2]
MKAAKPDLLVLWTNVCLGDDVKSFEALYRYLYTGLLKLSVYYVNSREIAEDIVAEVFVKCWENRKVSTHILNPESYFFVAIRNQSLKHLKKNSGVTFIDLGDTGVHDPVNYFNPESILEQKELHKKLDDAIETLPSQAKIIFRLIKENGMKYKEVAEVLEISPRTVQTQLFRAIAKLRLILRPSQQNNAGEEIAERLISLIIILGMISFFNIL